MAYDYNGFVTALAQEAAITATNTDFVTMLPTFIQNAELRIYRDLDLLATVFRDTGGVVTLNQRSFSLPQTYGRFVVVEAVNLFISGVRQPGLIPVSREFMDQLHPAETAPLTTSIPRLFCRDADQSILLGPSAGSASGVTGAEVVGTVRPSPLSVSNPTTFISQYLPDLLLSAAMVDVAGWMKNYGAQADDAKLAVSWETVYQTRIGAVVVEENRKKFQSGSWAPKAPVQVQPERG
jgi:hypothetical protein